jgi:hypothetical protein
MEFIMPVISSPLRLLQHLVLWCAALLLPPLSVSAVVLTPQEQAIADKLSASARPFIVIDPILTSVARARAKDLADRHYFSHVNPDGEGPNYLVEKAGYKLPDYWGDDKAANYVESIAAGQSTASATWSDWMGSAPHKKHLMAEDDFYAKQTSVGVGYYADPNSEYMYYWVVISAPPQPTPSLSVTTPAAGSAVYVPQVAVGGKTGGTTIPQSVVYRVENAAGTGTFVTAAGTTAWTGLATGLQPGLNTIRFRSLNASGATIAEATRVVNYILLKPLTVTVNGDGSVTPGFAGTTQRAVGATYTIQAVPTAATLFAGWSGSSSVKTPTLTFRMAEGYNLTANFVPNPFLTRRGGYKGLITGGASGSLTVVVSPNGQFTGRLAANGQSYSVSGRFGVDGKASLNLTGGVHLDLQLDVTGTGGITATASGALTATMAASSAYKPADGDYPHAGRYTVVLPPNPQSTDSTLPQGNGFGVLTITKTGRFSLAGALADGSTIATNGPVLANNQVPIFLPMYGARGFVAGTMTLRTSDVSDLDGMFHWSKPEMPNARIHPGALETDLPIVGAAYVTPVAGQPVFSVPTGTENSAITLADGNLAQPIVQTCTLDVANRLVPSRAPLDTLRAILNVNNGVFSGTFLHPITGAPTRFRGVIFQKQTAGYGFFLGTDQSGTASLTPKP